MNVTVHIKPLFYYDTFRLLPDLHLEALGCLFDSLTFLLS